MIQMAGTHFIRALTRACRAQMPLLLATLIVASLYIFGEPLYQANDDPGLAMAGAGFGEASRPEPHLVWSHFGYGLILGGLSHVVGPNAHGWVTIFAIWLSLILVIRAGLSAPSPPVRLAVLLLCIGCIFLTALLSAEFTITASVLFGAAISNWLVTADQEQPRRHVWTGAMVLALILSYLLRPESYVMGLVIVLPPLIFLCWHPSRIRWSARFLIVFLPVIIILGWSEKIAYSTSREWRNVPKYMDLIDQINMYGRVPWSPQAPEYRKVGWTETDYAMFGEWYTRDPIYSLNNLAFLVKNLAIPVNVTTAAQIRDWLLFLFTSWPLALVVFAQLIICLILDRVRRWLGLLLLLGEFGAIAAAALTGREPLDYVWTAALAITLMSLCALLVLTPQGHDLRRRRGLALIGLVGLVTATCVLSDHLRICRDAAAYRAWISQNRELFRGKVTVWGTGLLWEYLITPTRIYAPFPELKVASIDDITCMPIETAMLKELKIDDLAKELCTDPDMRLLAPKDLIETLTGFCKQHYGVNPVFKEAATWEDTGIYVLENQPGSVESDQE